MNLDVSLETISILMVSWFTLKNCNGFKIKTKLLNKNWIIEQIFDAWKYFSVNQILKFCLEFSHEKSQKSMHKSNLMFQSENIWFISSETL